VGLDSALPATAAAALAYLFTVVLGAVIHVRAV
jgi:hypothetical protein